MIGGRVLDTSTLLAFARGTSLYAAAAVWTAVEESIVLIVPSTALAAAWTELADEHRPVLDVLLHLGVSLTKLPGTAIRGIPPGQRTAAAALRCSRQRPTRKTISVVTSSNSRV
ncbi:MAG: hypothetical protein JO063_14880, partial [Pseudonocardiales bacterium]|nr:hypothetical protein [Pseudonocardiales bacterium]